MFLMSKVSCGWVRQKRAVSTSRKTNLRISVGDRDGHEDGFERAKSVWRLFCDP